MPDDLKYVKKVALERVCVEWGDAEVISRVLRLCGGVEELFLVEGNLDLEIEEWESSWPRHLREIKEKEDQKE
jgi:hypothetical protein